MTSQKFARIHELADATGVSMDTIRRSEAAGILPPPERDHRGWRLYRPAAIDLVERTLFPRTGTPGGAA